MDSTTTPAVAAETLVLVTGTNAPAAEPVKPARKSRAKAPEAPAETPSNITRRADGLTITDY